MAPDERRDVVGERRGAGGTCSAYAVDERLGDPVDDLVGSSSKKRSWRSDKEAIPRTEIHGKGVIRRGVVGER